jgi:putative transposase
MARLSRLVVPGEVHLVRQCAIQGQQPFADDADCERFIDTLRRASAERGVSVQAYSLLPDGWLMLGTPTSADALGKMMQALSRWFVTEFNRRHAREGALWRSRFTAAPLSASHVIDAVLYVELAPQRAGVASALDYRWSSAPHHVTGARDPLLGGHRALWGLGNTPFEREAAHGRLLERGLDPSAAQAIEHTLLKGWALASPGEIDSWSALGRRLAPLPRGRPRAVRN